MARLLAAEFIPGLGARDTRSGLRLPAKTLGLALRGLLLLLLAGNPLDGEDDVRALLAEPLEVDVLDELRQGRLPGLLTVVVDLPQFCRIQPKLPRHLHVGVGQVVPLPGLDPGEEARGDATGG